jgi:hypothetical protein
VTEYTVASKFTVGGMLLLVAGVAVLCLLG